MFYIAVDLPFEIGQIVIWMKSRIETQTIECPFCHGKVNISLGVYETIYKDGKDQKAEMIAKCKMCVRGKMNLHVYTKEDIPVTILDILKVYKEDIWQSKLLIRDYTGEKHEVYAYELRRND